MKSRLQRSCFHFVISSWGSWLKERAVNSEFPMQPVPMRWICSFCFEGGTVPETIDDASSLANQHVHISLRNIINEDFYSSFNQPPENYIERIWIINCSTGRRGKGATTSQAYWKSVVTLKLPPLCYSVCSAFVSIIHLLSSVVKTSLLLLLASTETVTNCNPPKSRKAQILRIHERWWIAQTVSSFSGLQRIKCY